MMSALARFGSVVDHSTMPTVGIIGLTALVASENEQPAAPAAPVEDEAPPAPPVPLIPVAGEAPLHARSKRTPPKGVDTKRAAPTFGIFVQRDFIAEARPASGCDSPARCGRGRAGRAGRR